MHDSNFIFIFRAGRINSEWVSAERYSRDSTIDWSIMKNFEIAAYVGQKLAGQDASDCAQLMDIGQIDKSEGEEEDVNVVQQGRRFERQPQTRARV